MKTRKACLKHLLSILPILTVGLMLWTVPSFAQETEEEKPERLVTMAIEYPGIKIPTEKNVSMKILLYNNGKTGEDVEVWVAEAPEGWDAVIKTYKFTVTGIHVPSGETKTLDFEAEPDETITPGKYEFRIEAQTPDQRFKMAQLLTVTVEKKQEEAKESKDITLNTTYPVLRGPTDAKFEFSVEVKSDLDEDAVFDLAANGPEGWEINFKPGYESKYISSLQIQANQSKNVSVEIKPPITAKAGEYPVTVRVSSGDEAKAEIELKVVLTGTYGLQAGTLNDLLSLDAKPGNPSMVSVYIKNTGSAPNQNIQFMTFKPENWKVEFEPEKLDVLNPGEVKQVEVKITPYEEALVGDYSVAVEIQGEKASKTLEFRTTVKASAAWGWIGILIIVAVVGGLTTLFKKLGRR
ncbi:hypothetical protein TSC_c19020 [Candidatus Vecturithrix granuli]|uniref:Alpha-galactosidase NEW3 domain-containing protein n=1 Tax=Vecturithrix granuli TaxID=1499967 RepID=A0A081C8K7_VECG1|nr:hypothetical protein TSC_c19020 [Candidatus Vecturithrix granuli]